MGAVATMARQLRLFAIAATMAFATAAGAQGTLHRGNDGDPVTLDPQRGQSNAEANLLRDVMEGLFVHDARGTPVPGATQEWSLSPDGLVWTFRLRPDARWQDGTTVTAEDFASGLRRALDPATASPHATLLAPITGVEARDTETLIIRLMRPAAQLPHILAHRVALPVHRPSLEALGAAYGRPDRFVGNGPYRLREMQRESHILLEREPGFHAAASVPIARVIWYPTGEGPVSTRRFATGELHTTSDVPPGEIAGLRARLGEQLVVTAGAGIYALIANTARPELRDARVRHALSLALDRNALARLWDGAMTPAGSLAMPVTTSPAANPERARALLAAAGHGPGKPLDIELRSNETPANRRTMEAIAEQWRAVGVEARVILRGGTEHMETLRGGDFALARYGWLADYPDTEAIHGLVRSDDPRDGFARHAVAQLDALLDMAGAAREPGDRAAILALAEARLAQELPWIPLLDYTARALVSAKVEGYAGNPLGIAPSRFLRLQP